MNRPDLAECLVLEGLESVRPDIKKMVRAEYAKMLNKRDGQKCRIFIPKSRILFGVCDPADVLKPGECSVRITSEEGGHPKSLANAEILVTRNPTLHPGDSRKLKAVHRKELDHLVDCIVFSTRGKRPSVDMMSGTIC
jgi:regulator of nonsense transcripts 1